MSDALETPAGAQLTPIGNPADAPAGLNVGVVAGTATTPAQGAP